MSDFHNIPPEMRETPHWIVWRLEKRVGQSKPTKVPYSVHGGFAKTNDGSTWGTFDEAIAMAADGRFNGIGFVFTQTPIVAVDLDGVIDESGGYSPEAANILRSLSPTYVERSQSGRGLHIISKGRLPTGGRRKGFLEMYDASSPRYFAMTGDIVEGSVSMLTDQTLALAAVHAQYIGSLGAESAAPASEQKSSSTAKVTDSTTEALVAQVMASQDGRVFSPLYIAGETRPGKSGSESDMTMACILARYTRDRDLITAVMKSSALKRPKWQEQRPGGTILTRVIDAALRQVPERPHTSSLTGDQSVSVAEFIKNGLPAPPAVVVSGLAWSGRVTLLAAREGLGKSTLFAEAAAAVSSGRAFLGGESGTVQGPVLWILVEEHAGDFARRAVHAAGGSLEDKENRGTGLENLYFLDRPADRLEALKAEVARVKPRLVIIDTLHAFASPYVERASQSDDWQTVMTTIDTIARSESQPAVLMAAQANRSTGEYRDSTAIGHGVDVVLTLKSFGESDPITREIVVAKARWPVGKTTYQLKGASTAVDGALVGGRLVRIGNVDRDAGRKAAENTKNDQRMLRALSTLPRDKRIGSNEMRKLCLMGKKTAGETVERLIKNLRVQDEMIGKDHSYGLTDLGYADAARLPAETVAERTRTAEQKIEARLDEGAMA